MQPAIFGALATGSANQSGRIKVKKNGFNMIAFEIFLVTVLS